MFEQLELTEQRLAELDAELARPEVSADFGRVADLARERSSLAEVVDLYREYKSAGQALAEARSLAEDGDDRELQQLAREEAEAAQARLEDLEARLTAALLPRDPNDERNVILEARAGTGGDEAALFAADLFRMYSRYAERQNWQVEVLSANESGIGGFKEIIAEIRGRGAYSRLKFESGVHRVQRVPDTEAQGRIHTSTATVAVLPEVEDVEVDIREDELRIDIFHSGGAGGQNVNKVATAVRLTHVPTGIVVVCQDERSQLKNRTKAMSVLRARLYDQEMQKQTSEITEARRAQVGSGERSEKIRTYNFPQDRVTDHRIGLTMHNLPAILSGELDELIDAVATADQAARLAAAK
jgi:peptide chain release factor 1